MVRNLVFQTVRSCEILEWVTSKSFVSLVSINQSKYCRAYWPIKTCLCLATRGVYFDDGSVRGSEELYTNAFSGKWYRCRVQALGASLDPRWPLCPGQITQILYLLGWKAPPSEGQMALCCVCSPWRHRENFYLHPVYSRHLGPWDLLPNTFTNNGSALVSTVAA